MYDIYLYFPYLGNQNVPRYKRWWCKQIIKCIEKSNILQVTNNKESSDYIFTEKCYISLFLNLNKKIILVSCQDNIIIDEALLNNNLIYAILDHEVLINSKNNKYIYTNKNNNRLFLKLDQTYNVKNSSYYKQDITKYSKVHCLLNQSMFFKKLYIDDVKLLKDRFYDIIIIGHTNYSDTVLTLFKKDLSSFIKKIGKKYNYKIILEGFVSHKQYYKLLLDSKIFISSYGWGEFSLKEYDCICTGTYTFKSDVYFKSYPNFYENMETYKLDFSDIEDKLQNTLKNLNMAQEKVDKNRTLFRNFQKSNSQVQELESILK